MNRITGSILLSVFIVTTIFCQSNFEIVRDFDQSVLEKGRSVLEMEENLYIITSGVSTDLPKLYLSKYDQNGNLKWDKTLIDFGTVGNTFHALTKLDFTLTGIDYNKDIQTSLKIDTSGLIDTLGICISDSLISANLSSSIIFGSHLVTSMNSFVDDETNTVTALCWLDLYSGNQDTIIIEQKGFGIRIGDLIIDPDSLLTVVYMYQDPIIKSDYYRSIHKFNKEKEKVWEWTSEKLDGRTSLHGFTLSILDDGRMVHTNGRFTYKSRESPSIRAINPDGSLSWYYDFPVWLLPMPSEDFFQYDLAHHITTKNNDIVGCGWYNDVDDKAYLFRMSSEGEMLWERYYYTPDNIIVDNFGNNRVSGGVFIDVEELENGDLAVVGEKHIRSQNPDGTLLKEEDLWLLRLNADGCNGDYCGESRYTMTTSTEEEIINEESFTIFPNPSSVEITIESNKSIELEIVSSMGELQRKLTINEGKNTVDISRLPSGIYFVRSYSIINHQVEVMKFVKI